MAYTRGNLAVQEKPVERAYPGYREKTKVVTRRTYLPMKEKFLYLLTLAFCVVIATLLIWQNSHIYDLNKQNQTIIKDMNKSKRNIAQLEVQKQQLEQNLRSEAEKLGYSLPEGNQSIHVSRTSSTPTNKADASMNTAPAAKK
ncbi:FtsB/FtsL family cell division protein [Paenibacillus pini]|uniref:Cell division protein FtsL n=1 Tax=Paenibacillus pini JCM 16418 TaxID=1236976 RepID=W7Y850_9BACL|nr:hypothetical protein [Paenibacillus pini]GAF07080.1 hypothetical protein JCM16418_1069 [Paenibacillus pini JCM 16418]